MLGERGVGGGADTAIDCVCALLAAGFPVLLESEKIREDGVQREVLDHFGVGGSRSLHEYLIRSRSVLVDVTSTTKQRDHAAPPAALADKFALWGDPWNKRSE